MGQILVFPRTRNRQVLSRAKPNSFVAKIYYEGSFLLSLLYFLHTVFQADGDAQAGYPVVHRGL
jgi:hypothetical protein